MHVAEAEYPGLGRRVNQMNPTVMKGVSLENSNDLVGNSSRGLSIMEMTPGLNEMPVLI